MLVIQASSFRLNIRAMRTSSADTCSEYIEGSRVSQPTFVILQSCPFKVTSQSVYSSRDETGLESQDNDVRCGTQDPRAALANVKSISTYLVRILHSEDELPLPLSRDEVVDQRSPQPSEMEVTGRGRGESHSRGDRLLRGRGRVAPNTSSRKGVYPYPSGWRSHDT